MKDQFPLPSVPRRESVADRVYRASLVAVELGKEYPDADCALVWRTPFELLIATILSAQCTDVMVNRVTPELFERYPDAHSLARAPQASVEKIILRTGFYSQKARALRATSQALVERFAGEVPKRMEDLVSLQGVGRKTASVVLGTAFGIPAVFVDTHVRRISNRLGLVKEQDPEKIEASLRKLLPSEGWVAFCHRMIHHGRRICAARMPQCGECPLLSLCPRVGVEPTKRLRRPKKA